MGPPEIPFLKLVYTQTPTTSQLPLRFSYQLLVPVAVSALGSSGSLDLLFLQFSGWEFVLDLNSLIDVRRVVDFHIVQLFSLL